MHPARASGVASGPDVIWFAAVHVSCRACRDPLLFWSSSLMTAGLPPALAQARDPIPGGGSRHTQVAPGGVGRSRHRGSGRRWNARRSHVAGRDAARRFRAGRAVRRATRLGTDRGAHSLRRRGDLRRGHLLRPRSIADRHDRHAPRRGPGRDGLVSDDLRHLSRPAERVRVRHQRGGRSVRRAGARPG